MEGIAVNGGKAAGLAVDETRPRPCLEVFRTSGSAQALGGGCRELCPDDRSAYPYGVRLRWAFRRSRISDDRLKASCPSPKPSRVPGELQIREHSWISRGCHLVSRQRRIR